MPSGVWAQTPAISAIDPLVIHILVPDSSQSLPLWISAWVCIPDRSLPWLSVLGGMAGPLFSPRRQRIRARRAAVRTRSRSGMMAIMSNVNGSKTLVRTRDGRILAGVCSGLAEYFRIDVNLIRVIVTVLTLFGGFGALAS